MVKQMIGDEKYGKYGKYGGGVIIHLTTAYPL